MLTELRAVNRMLALIDEAPVTDVTVEIPEVVQAREVLDQVLLEVLAKGWHFNTDDDYPLEPGVDRTIQPPSNAISVDATDPRKDIIVRQGSLYNKTDRTYFFDEPVDATVVWKFDFSALPYPAQNFIMIRAARRFQRDVLGSVKLEQLSAADEQQAYIVLVDFDGATADYNLLTNNPEARAMAERRMV